MLDPYQVLEARAWGADAVLLIAAALSADQMRELAQTASEVEIDVLIESHSEPEIEQALQIPGALIGINNRNLETFEVSLATTERLKRLIPDDRFAVSEAVFTRKRMWSEFSRPASALSLSVKRS